MLTAFYSLRLLFIVFHLPQDAARAATARAQEAAALPIAHGMQAHAEAHETHGEGHGEAHGAHDGVLGHEGHGHEGVREPSWWMLAPLAFLGVGAIFSGAFLYYDFVGGHAEEFWHGALAMEHDPLVAAYGSIPFLVKAAPLLAGLAGALLAVAIYLWRRGAAQSLAERFPRLHRFLLRKWYFDELYNRVFVRSAWRFGGAFFHRGDQGTIDRFGPDGVSQLASAWGRHLRAFQTGYLYHYALWMLLGFALLMGWVLVAVRASAF